MNSTRRTISGLVEFMAQFLERLRGVQVRAVEQFVRGLDGAARLVRKAGAAQPDAVDPAHLVDVGRHEVGRHVLAHARAAPRDRQRPMRACWCTIVAPPRNAPSSTLTWPPSSVLLARIARLPISTSCPTWTPPMMKLSLPIEVAVPSVEARWIVAYSRMLVARRRSPPTCARPCSRNPAGRRR